MNNVKRFVMAVRDGEDPYMKEFLTGPYVEFSDYSLLLARLERMQKALKNVVHYCETCDALAGEGSEDAQSMRRNAYAEMAEAITEFQSASAGGATPEDGKHAETSKS